jgi:hypothetical protein
MIDQNAGEKALILQASSPAVSDTLFDSSQAQRLQNQSINLCRGRLPIKSLPLSSVPVLPEVQWEAWHGKQLLGNLSRKDFVLIRG